VGQPESWSGGERPGAVPEGASACRPAARGGLGLARACR
jgi:hypothetical protein